MEAPGAVPLVVALHRYPVTSMLGERLAEVPLHWRGVAADRRWSVRTREGKIASGEDTRRFAAVPGLQQVRAQHTQGDLDVALPHGRVHAPESKELDELLSRLLGEPVTLEPEADVSHVDDGPVSPVARASVHALTEHRGEHVDEARFRPDVVVDGLDRFAEEDWIDRRLRIGSAVLYVQQASPRCLMVDDATADLPARPGNLRAVGQLNGAPGRRGRVEQPGVLQVGDRISVE